MIDLEEIKRIELFSNLSEEQLTRVAEVANISHAYTGKTIFTQGEPLRACNMVRLSGWQMRRGPHHSRLAEMSL